VNAQTNDHAAKELIGWPKKFGTLFVRLITSSNIDLKPFSLSGSGKIL